MQNDNAKFKKWAILASVCTKDRTDIPDVYRNVFRFFLHFNLSF